MIRFCFIVQYPHCRMRAFVVFPLPRFQRGQDGRREFRGFILDGMLLGYSIELDHGVSGWRGEITFGSTFSSKQWLKIDLTVGCCTSNMVESGAEGHRADYFGET